MNFDVQTTPHFQKSLKRLVKKYPFLRGKYAQLIAKLEKEPENEIPLGKKCFKIRIAIESKGKGKSGGGRVITFVQVLHLKVTLLDIFDTSEMENISETQLSFLLINIHK
jgi:mRNA-degrading endonuclease RelE of RelBE toxin-antitoxin system